MTTPHSTTSALRIATAFCAALLLGYAGSGPAEAQDPKSSVVNKIIVPYGPGGPSDVVARLLAAQLQTVLDQTFIVENRAGAGSAIGARFVASAPPDGHTILLGNVSTFAIVPAVTKNPGYDPVKSFTPIMQTSGMSLVMITQPDFPANTVQEFVAYAKAHPKKISYASAGVGNSAHLLGELLQARGQLDMVHVPYRSGAELNGAVLGGQVQFAMSDLSAALSLIREGKVKALAVTDTVRAAALPNVPTMIEAGYPEIVFNNWTGAAAPPGTPPAIVKKLQSAITQVIKSPEYQSRITSIGGDARPGTSDEFAKLIAADYRKWGQVAKSANISLD